jgi:hypothetical protein
VKKIQRNFTEVALFFLSRLMSPLSPEGYTETPLALR